MGSVHPFRSEGITSVSLEALARTAEAYEPEDPISDKLKIECAWHSEQPLVVEEVVRGWIITRAAHHVLPDSTRVERWLANCRKQISYYSHAKYSPAAVSSGLWSFVKKLND